MPTTEQLKRAMHLKPVPRIPLRLVVEKLHDDAQLPAQQSAQAAGYDIAAYLNGRTLVVYDQYNRAREESVKDLTEARYNNRPATDAGVYIFPGERMLIPTGFKTVIPEGYFGDVRIRSGTAVKAGLRIANGSPVIDADYRGEWFIPLHNPTERPVRIAHGERIAQVVFHQYETLPVVEGPVDATERGAGGFGSTGS